MFSRLERPGHHTRARILCLAERSGVVDCVFVARQPKLARFPLPLPGRVFPGVLDACGLPPYSVPQYFPATFIFRCPALYDLGVGLSTNQAPWIAHVSTQFNDRLRVQINHVACRSRSSHEHGNPATHDSTEYRTDCAASL